MIEWLETVLHIEHYRFKFLRKCSLVRTISFWIFIDNANCFLDNCLGLNWDCVYKENTRTGASFLFECILLLVLIYQATGSPNWCQFSFCGEYVGTAGHWIIIKKTNLSTILWTRQEKIIGILEMYQLNCTSSMNSTNLIWFSSLLNWEMHQSELEFSFVSSMLCMGLIYTIIRVDLAHDLQGRRNPTPKIKLILLPYRMDW